MRQRAETDTCQTRPTHAKLHPPCFTRIVQDVSEPTPTGRVTRSYAQPESNAVVLDCADVGYESLLSRTPHPPIRRVLSRQASESCSNEWRRMSLTHAEAVERARTLAPKIASRARETEELRRPHDDTIRELVDAGLLSLLTPKRWGGHELGLDTHRAVVETISKACMSTGWTTSFYIAHCVLATKFSEQAQAEFFAERPFILAPATTAPTIRTKRVDGGWTVSGTAPWGTGIMHADWVFCIGSDADHRMWFFAIPVADIAVKDVWHMSGMAGTGSNTIVVDNVFVPDYRTVPGEAVFAGETVGTSLHDNPLYRTPLSPFLLVATMPVFSGALRGAADEFETITRRRVTTYTGAAMKDNKYAHIKLGEAGINALIAERLVADQIRQTEALLETSFSIDDRIRLKTQAAAIVEHCRTAINDMAHNGGATSFGLHVPLQRFFRDINVLVTHAFWGWESIRELGGRHALGLAPNTPMI